MVEGCSGGCGKSSVVGEDADGKAADSCVSGWMFSD